MYRTDERTRKAEAQIAHLRAVLAGKAQPTPDDAVLLKTVPTTDAPRSLADLGYGFNDDGELRQLANGERFVYVNEALYQTLGDMIVPYLWQRMVSDPDFDLDEVHLPLGAGPDEPTVPVFVSKNLAEAKKVMVLVHGAGAVRAGQWARALCLNDSLTTGSVLPYIRKAKERGFAVIVANPNLNETAPPPFEETLRGEEAQLFWLSFPLKATRKPSGFVPRPIPQNERPERHVVCLWDALLAKCPAQDIVFVSHSYGGVSTKALMGSRMADFGARVKCVAFTDAVHSVSRSDPPEMLDFFAKRTRNWVSSSQPLDAPEYHGLQPCVSAGTSVHERTSACSIESVFKFVDQHSPPQ